jgi:sporulation protein YlmC with PRC-barrel domain
MVTGYAIAATDGHIGTVSDFFFDDQSWQIRWLVVDTGHWLSGRKVLLPPSVLGKLSPEHKEFAVKLTMQQIKDSPDIDSEKSVSRQMESSVYDYYGWNPYWSNGFAMGGYGYLGGGYLGGPMTASSSAESDQRAQELADAETSDDNPHLRSINAVTGYHIRATDGEIGHVEDFLVDDTDWSIHYLVVDTKNWWPGEKVLISPRSASQINWSERLVTLDVDRQKVKDSPPYDDSSMVDQAYEKRFDHHYGDPRGNDLP